MAIKKCEKCSLNYVKEGEKYCKVCQKLLNSKKPAVEKAELCPSCGAKLIAKGYELCTACLTDVLDTVDKFQDENGEIIDQDITPADMEISAIDVDEDEAIDDSQEEDMPEEIKHEIEEDDYDLIGTD